MSIKSIKYNPNNRESYFIRLNDDYTLLDESLIYSLTAMMQGLRQKVTASCVSRGMGIEEI